MKKNKESKKKSVNKRRENLKQRKMGGSFGMKNTKATGSYLNEKDRREEALKQIYAKKGKSVNLKDRNNITRKKQKTEKENVIRTFRGNISRKINYSTRLNLLLVMITILFIMLIGKLAHIVIFQGEELTKKATDQQVVSKVINPSRGSILDRNGEVLAQSVPVDTVSINPKSLKTAKDKQGKELDLEFFSVNTASILEVDLAEIREKVNSEKNIETLARYINVDKVKKYKEFLNQNGLINFVSFEQDNKRVYPYGNLASQLIGFCGTDNTGLEGLERSYNDVLSGRPGRITSIGDGSKNLTSEFPERIIKEENGKDLYLSIDIKMQSSVEKHLAETVEKFNANSGVVIAMNPKNGEILSMANYPSFDLNKPFNPVGMDKEKWDTLDIQDKNNRLQDIWKNKSVSDPYEPGSVFKLVTAAIGLELDVAEANTPGDFFCSGYQQVMDRKIHCWNKKGQGAQSLHQAIQNSCNPSMIQLGQRIGRQNFIKYMGAFGFFNRTGADISGESVGQFFRNDHFNEVELATLSFGQRFTINPLQMANAISAIVNGGQLYKPSIIHKIKNETKGTVEHINPVLVRKVISEEHSKEIREMMRSVVEKGTGVNAKVEGYSTGGKTGTSEPAPNDKHAGYTASYIGAAPIEEPEIVILAVIKNPKKISHEGSVVAAPMVAKILKDVLPGMQKTNLLDLKETKISNKEEGKVITIPNVEGKTVFEARSILQKEGLIAESSLVSNMNEIIVETQMPKGGSLVSGEGIVFLRTKENRFDMVKMPDLKGNSLEVAKDKLKNIGLNYNIQGTKGNVVSQDVPKDTEIEKGRVITLKIE